MYGVQQQCYWSEQPGWIARDYHVEHSEEENPTPADRLG